jgi:hypothetical protein
VPVLELAASCGLAGLVGQGLTLREAGGVNAHLKVPALVAGMVAGADSIEDMDLLRHGAMSRLFGGVRAPSTLGTCLRSFTNGTQTELSLESWRVPYAAAGWSAVIFSYSLGDINAAELWRRLVLQKSWHQPRTTARAWALVVK